MYMERTCYLCGRNGAKDHLDKHHIFGGAYRNKSEHYGLTVYLCHDRCHENGEHAVHRDAGVMRELRQYGQRKAMEENGWTVGDFIREFGKNYLDPEEELRQALQKAGLKEEESGQLRFDTQAGSIAVVGIRPDVFALTDLELPF